MLLGVMLVVLSTVMATQYTWTKARYTLTISHPTEADIRFIGSDNSSDGNRLLNADASNLSVALRFGNWSANTNKTWTAAFGIVNEERFAVNITHVNVSCVGPVADYLQIWLHGDRDTQQEDETNSTVLLFNKNATSWSGTSTAWVLGPGDGNPGTMRHNASVSGDDIPTPWDTESQVRYCIHDTKNAHNSSDTATGGKLMPEFGSDFVWVQISIDVPVDPSLNSMVGHIHFHFKATTFWTDVTQP